MRSAGQQADARRDPPLQRVHEGGAGAAGLGPRLRRARTRCARGRADGERSQKGGLPLRSCARTSSGRGTAPHRLVSLQPLQHARPGAHVRNVQGRAGPGVRAGGAVSTPSEAKPSFDAKEFVGTLPRRPGVYRMYGGEGDLLYVGKARSLKDRVGSYFSPAKVDPRIQALVHQIANIEVTVTNSETEALLLEYNLIKAQKPRFNVVLRDDKSFPYI